MEIKIIDGIEYTKEADYLLSHIDSEINHLLVDVQDNKIIAIEKMICEEKEKRNREAREVGETYLVWVPALF